jgi:hypothetical protein
MRETWFDLADLIETIHAFRFKSKPGAIEVVLNLMELATSYDRYASNWSL